MFNIITTLAVGLDDALEKTGKIVRTVGPVLGLGDTHHLISYGPIEPPMPLHCGYESVRLFSIKSTGGTSSRTGN